MVLVFRGLIVLTIMLRVLARLGSDRNELLGHEAQRLASLGIALDVGPTYRRLSE